MFNHHKIYTSSLKPIKIQHTIPLLCHGTQANMVMIVSLSVCRFMFHPSVVLASHPSIYLSVCSSINHPPICLSVRQSIFLSVSVIHLSSPLYLSNYLIDVHRYCILTWISSNPSGSWWISFLMSALSPG